MASFICCVISSMKNENSLKVVYMQQTEELRKRLNETFHRVSFEKVVCKINKKVSLNFKSGCIHI